MQKKKIYYHNFPENVENNLFGRTLPTLYNKIQIFVEKLIFFPLPV
jgi:hypothetical protein